MTAADVATVITAAGTLVTAVGGAVFAWRVVVPAARATREVVTLAEETKDAAVATSHMVNSQRDDMLARIDVLAQALQEAGVAIPADSGRRESKSD